MTSDLSPAGDHQTHRRLQEVEGQALDTARLESLIAPPACASPHARGRRAI
jgi:hypothetical protein